MCDCTSRFAACFTTVQVAATKIFLGGFAWQAFAFASRQPSSSWAFAVAAGAGDAAGTFIGNALLLAGLAYWRGWPGTAYVVRSGLVVASGCILSGAIWQQLVNRLSRAGASFEVGMLVTGLACGAAFLVGITLGACASARATRQPSDYAKDLSLAVAVVGATGFFVGTDTSWHGNWLQQLVGERDGSSPPLDCLKAGFSVVLGFVAVQILLIALVPPRFMWTTPDPPERRTLIENGVPALRPPTRSLAPTWGSAHSLTMTHDRSTPGTLGDMTDTLLERPTTSCDADRSTTGGV